MQTFIVNTNYYHNGQYGEISYVLEAQSEIDAKKSVLNKFIPENSRENIYEIERSTKKPKDIIFTKGTKIIVN